MKNLILILAMLFFISSCNNDEEGLITENATVYHDFFVRPEFIISYCNLIETESNKVFIPKASHILSKLDVKFNEFNFNNSSSKVKITYRVTGDKPNRGDCRHKDRIPTAVIEVIRIKKIK